jgi:hypothetical protein
VAYLQRRFVSAWGRAEISKSKSPPCLAKFARQEWGTRRPIQLKVSECRIVYTLVSKDFLVNGFSRNDSSSIATP